MPLAALAFALAAAVVHATWNAGVAGATDTRAATAVALVAGALACAPFAALTWDVDAAAIPYAAASALAEVAYIVLLAAAYGRAEMSVVYPIARGAAPVLVLAGSVVALSTRPSGAQVAGVALVAAGVLAVRGRGAQRAGAADVGLAGRPAAAPSAASGGVGLAERPTAPPWAASGDVGGLAGRPAAAPSAASGGDLALSLGVAACIATYTVIDKRGLSHAAPLPYLELAIGGAALLYAAGLLVRGEAAAMRSAVSARSLGAGLGMFAAYGLTLAALRLASAPAVAAVRETSVVFGVAIAWAALGRSCRW